VFWISGSNTIGGVSPSLTDSVIVNRFLGIPLVFYYGVALCVIVWYLLEFTPVGRRLLVVGRSRNVARLSGLHVNRLRWGALVASGVISALAGILYVGTTGGADPTSVQSFCSPHLPPAFLGTTTIVPGKFNPWGAIVAVSSLQRHHWAAAAWVQSFVQQLFYGGALVLALQCRS